MSKALWIIAAENGAIPGGKVGGVGDVIHHLPPALAAQGWPSRVITPAYGRLHGVPGARAGREVTVEFAGETHTAQTYRLPPPAPGVDLRVIDHPLLAPHRDGRIYHPDAPDRPFETDSVKFAFFCAAVAAWAEVSEAPPRLLHLNDWHTGLIPALRTVSAPDSALRRARCVFTIHNLAYQGVRPLDDGAASFRHWFPDWPGDTAVLADPRYEGCMNFMAAALRLCDGLSTVSPSYAREIQRPSDPAHGFAGGEGLESELSEAARAGRLTGILNGCDYPPGAGERIRWEAARERILAESDLLAASGDARERLEGGAGRAPGTVLLSIGRAAHQKVDLFLQEFDGHASALDAIAGALGDDGLLLVLGSGEPELEARLAAVAERQPRFIYLRGYAEGLSESLYAAADLFLMPSTFEPCGISQLLALRAGQPCVVHAVGGLRDTVVDGETGFHFGGATPEAQARAFAGAVGRALRLRRDAPEAWRAMSARAAAQRFDWERAARAYAEELYAPQA